MKDPLAGCTYDRVYQDLKEFSKNGETFCKQLMSVLQQRADLEISYAKGLQKMANKLTRALENMKKNCIYNAFACVSEEMCSTGELHQKLGMAIQTEAIKPTTLILEEHDKKKKSLDNEVEKMTGPVINNWRQQIKTKKKLVDHTKKHEAFFHTVNDGRKSVGEKEKQKLLNKLKKSAEILTKTDDDYYRENIEGHAARLKWETALEICYQGIQDLEKERIQLLCNILNRYNQHVSNFGQTLSTCQKQIDNAISKVDVEKDIQNFMEETSISSEENKSEFLLTDYYEEDLKNEMHQERRTQSLNMKIERLHNDIEKASRDEAGLAKMLRACRENPAFSDAKNQEDTALLLDETKLKLCLLEANFYKLSSVMAELETKQEPLHPCSNCIFTWEEKGYQHTSVQISRPIRMKRLERSLSVMSTSGPGPKSSSQRFSKHNSKLFSWTDKRDSTKSAIITGAAAAHAPDTGLYEDVSQTDGSSEETASTSKRVKDTSGAPETISLPEGIPDTSGVAESIILSGEIPDTSDVSETIINPSEATQVTAGVSDPSTCLCRAIYTYQAQREDELSLKKGDVVMIRHRSDDGWWYGTSKKKKGYFPSTYVEEQNPLTDTE